MHDQSDDDKGSSNTQNSGRICETWRGITLHKPISAFLELQKKLCGIHEVDESERDIIEWRLFREWAEVRQAVYSDSFGRFSDNQGGHEHFVFLDEGYYYKRTKWNLAGYVFDPELKRICSATVSEYLLRLTYHDVLFGTNTDLIGIAVQGYDYAVLTRQEEIRGETPRSGQLDDFMLSMGCEEVDDGCEFSGHYKGKVYKHPLVYIADVRPDNCKAVLRNDGTIVCLPFDFFITPPESEE